MTRFLRFWLLQLFSLLLSTLFSVALWAGMPTSGSEVFEGEIKVVSVMNQEKLATLYGYPYVIGERDPDVAIWPLYQQAVDGQHLIGYVYESIEYSAIPGFMGIPFNLLVAIDQSGQFIDVKVLFQREPMFVGGIGTGPMDQFVAQYAGLSLMQNIQFSNNKGQKKNNVGNTIYLDGITGATASIRILNQTLLSSALKVARSKLGFGTSKDPELIAQIDTQVFDRLQWQQLIAQGLVKHTQLTPSNFAALEQTRSTPSATTRPLESSLMPVSLYVTDIALPSVGQNLLSQEGWAFLQSNLEPGDHALLVVSDGQHSFVHERSLRGGISDRLLLRQHGLPIELRDLDFAERFSDTPEGILNFPKNLASADWKIYRVIGNSGIDISQPLDFELDVSPLPESAFQSIAAMPHPFQYTVPSRYYIEPSASDKGWLSLWRNKVPELITFGLAFLLLAIALRYQSKTVQNPRFFVAFRLGFLCFTLVFIGWYAQGQLSVVNLTGAIQSIYAGGGLGFFLYDPMTSTVWAATAITFFIWGRGTFCGWLCPFGALQELVSQVGKWIGIQPRTVKDSWDRHLKKLKYLVLLLLVLVAFTSAPWTDRLVEIEPFKTTITFYLFEREWPYVAWALLIILASLFSYKGFCRYLCPLGALMALLGKVRLFNWLARRTECGNPCQLCKKACQYNAIGQAGHIDYNECFQCLDCVVIYESDEKCVPLILQKRSGRKLKSNPHIIAKELG